MPSGNKQLPSRPKRFLLALLVSAGAVITSTLPTDPLGTGGRVLTGMIIFVAYAAYVELSRNQQGTLQIPLWEMVLLGAISGGAIAVLIRLDVYYVLDGLGIGALLGAFAEWWTRFVRHI